MDTTFHKYPRTSHIQGSGIQKGDKDRPVVPFKTVRNQHLIVEEKLDGANCGVSFVNEELRLQSRGFPKLRLQSRGHTLTGGPRERQFDLFKAWAATHRDTLHGLLSDQFIMFGEWMYAKHSSFYDQLPHYFMEFDVYDRVTKKYLSTLERHKMFKDSPVVSVPVLFTGPCDTIDDLTKWIKPSLYKSDQWKENLITEAANQGLNPDDILEQTDLSQLAEGLYIKHEDELVIIERYKYVRPAFTQMLVESDEHWMNRPIVPNRLADGVDIFCG